MLLLWLLLDSIIPVFAATEPTQKAKNSSSPIEIAMSSPRSYGYNLGDLITFTAQIRTPLFYELEMGQLPKPGPINEWLELISITQQQPVSGFDYALSITYQIFKSAPAPTELTIPSLPLFFEHQGKNLSHDLPSWSFVFNPLIPDNLGNTLIQTQSPFTPDTLETNRQFRILYGLLFVASLIVLYIVWFYGKIPFLERYSGAFGRACKTLKELAKLPPSHESHMQALQCFHHALNELAGETIYMALLPKFFQENPKFKPLEEMTKKIFTASQQCFFYGKKTNDFANIEQIQALCLQFRKLERSYK